MEITPILEAPMYKKSHGFGEKGLDPLPVVCTWNLTTFDLHVKPTSFTFDPVQGSDPLLIGLDVSEYTNSLNLEQEPCVVM